MNFAPSHVPMQRWSPAGPLVVGSDAVAVEEPLEIRVAGRSLAVVMRTPGHDAELAAGFLLTEGVIRRAEDVLDLVPCCDQPGAAAGNVLDVLLAPTVAFDVARLTRHVFSSSSCGVCGKATLDAVLQTFRPVVSDTRFDPVIIARLPEQLRAVQPGFAATGGLHACALFDPTGKILQVREDVGRHNALDKILGRALLDRQLPLTQTGLLLSGRISFELVQKALAAHVPLIAGIGAPSSLAIDCAERGGQTLIGFLREDRFNIYAGARRLGVTASAT